ncbi:MAG: type I DNA topoisomerase [Planctomycetaceae bacterium]|nr:type I DNA topoisomerase [Planctomycetaceae bacterium]
MTKTSKDKTLVIVESPAKAKTINKYLGSNFEVKASMGHVRDLPSKGLNVDIENRFEPVYEITPGRKRVVAALKASLKGCGSVYLATDLDREGEAIAWHLKEILNLKDEDTYRVVFNAITKNDIEKAFAHPGKIDMHRVMAQQARRVLDRIVGYQISPLLWKKVARGLSAGRVQSVAVKMVVERERQIRAFVPEEYWLIPAVFTADMQAALTDEWRQFIQSAPDPEKGRTLLEQNQWLAGRKAFKADLITINDQKFQAKDTEQAHAVLSKLQTARYRVTDIVTRRMQSRPAPPFITSTLQQAAANRLGFSTKRTMIVAQQLYEGIDLGSMGALGLITYMRTDSTNLSNEALEAGRKFIHFHYGDAYLPEKPNRYASAKGAQEAHEAIRPTDPDLTPAEIRQFLSDEQYKLYDLVWRRFVACQMTAAQWDTTRIEIAGREQDFTCGYRAAGRVLVFDGFTKVWTASSTEEPTLPPVQVDHPLNLISVDAEQRFTKPPARYTEASLVKALEKEGIGRPSTYASIISTIQERKYVEQNDKKFYATDIGEVVTDKLNDYFPQVMDIAFTRHMEEQLDQIEEQHLDWVSVLEEFYGPFTENLKKAGQEMAHAKAETQPSEYTCPDCGAPLVYRFGKNGRFLSCSRYQPKPKKKKGKDAAAVAVSDEGCKFACPCDKDGKMIKEQVTEHACPNCGKPMVQKKGRFGVFLGCSDYPQCKTIMRLDKQGQPMPPKPPAEPTGLKCYKCKTGELVIRQSKRGPFMGCNKFPRCRTIVSMKKLDELKQLQDQGKWPPKTDDELAELLGHEAKENTAPRKKTATRKKTAARKKAEVSNG